MLNLMLRAHLKRKKVSSQKLYTNYSQHFIGLQKDHIVSQANGPACDETSTTGSDGLLKDIQVIDIDEPTKRKQAGHTQDINTHFSALYLNLDNKKVQDCNTCRCVTFSLHYQNFINHLCPSKQLKKCITIVDQTTTLQCYQQAAHEKMYWKWAADNGFTSMLPMDTKCH